MGFRFGGGGGISGFVSNPVGVINTLVNNAGTAIRDPGSIFSSVDPTAALKAEIERILSAVTGGFNTMDLDFDKLQGQIGTGFSGFDSKLDKGFSGLNTDLSKLSADLGSLDLDLGTLSTDLGSGFTDLTSDLDTGFADVTRDLSKGFDDVGAGMYQGFNELSGGLDQGFSDISRDLSKGFDDFGSGLTSGFNSVVRSVDTGFEGMSTDLDKGFSDISRDFDYGFNNIVNSVDQGFGGLKSGLDIMTSDFANEMDRFGKNIEKGTANTLKAFNDMDGWWKDTANSWREFVEDARNTAQNKEAAAIKAATEIEQSKDALVNRVRDLYGVGDSRAAKASADAVNRSIDASASAYSTPAKQYLDQGFRQGMLNARRNTGAAGITNSSMANQARGALLGDYLAGKTNIEDMIKGTRQSARDAINQQRHGLESQIREGTTRDLGPMQAINNMSASINATMRDAPWRAAGDFLQSGVGGVSNFLVGQRQVALDKKMDSDASQPSQPSSAPNTSSK